MDEIKNKKMKKNFLKIQKHLFSFHLSRINPDVHFIGVLKQLFATSCMNEIKQKESILGEQR